eukprot:1490881-Rhodomonas_salina.1
MTSVAECIECEAGTFCPVGSAEAIECAPGTFGNQAGASMCERCRAGTYQDTSGATSCKACRGGHYCAEGASHPLPCPAGTRNDESVAVMTSVAECI